MSHLSPSPPPAEKKEVLTRVFLFRRVKPKSLFAQASSKRLNGQEGLFGSKTTPTKE